MTPKPSTRGARRALGPRLALASAVLVSCLGVGFGLLEVALRSGLITNPRYSRSVIPDELARAERKLLILGDSFIVEDGGLAPILAEAFRARGVAVWNAATSGSGPFEYRAELEAAGRDFAPHVVLLSYYVGNDLSDVKHHPLFESRDLEGRARGIGIDRTATRRFPGNLYLFPYVRAQLRPLLERYFYFDWEAAARAGVAPELIEDARHKRINPWLLELSVRNPDYLLENILMETPGDRRAWEASERILSDIADRSEANGAELAVVIFPSSIQINESHFEFYRRLLLRLDPRTLRSTQPQRLLLEFCRRRALACLDLLPVFKARSEELYLDRNSHLNATGNRVAAETLVPFIWRLFE